MIRQDFIATIRQKLQSQRRECEERMREIVADDPFNLDFHPRVDDDRSSPYDDAQLNEQHERVMAQIEALKTMIARLDSALKRIENGTYGICEVCGKPIEELRLSAMPFAALCFADEKLLEKHNKTNP